MDKLLTLLVALIGLVMIYLGTTAPKLMLPPLLSGIAFLLIAVVLWKRL